MKKLAVSFMLLTGLVCACSTSKNTVNTTNANADTKAIVKQHLTSNANTGDASAQKEAKRPEAEAKMLSTSAVERNLIRKQPTKTMEEQFKAATARFDTIR